MERENLRLEALKMAEQILQNNYNNSFIKQQNSRDVVLNPPITEDIINLAQKLIDFIVK